MSEKTDDKVNIRKYLLGMIERDAERESIESRLMTDDVFFEEVMFHEEDLIQDYVDGELGAQDRRAFEKHFLITGEAREKLKFARIFRKYVDERQPANPPEPSRPHGFFGSFSQWRLPAAAALILGLIFAGWFFFARSTANQRATTALNQEYSVNRPLESRITDLKYAPFDSTRGPANQGELSDLMKKTENDLRDEAVDHPSSQSHHAFGRFYLAEKKFDKSAAQLEKARDLAPEDARILTDLGTAYLEKSNQPSDDRNRQQLKLRAQALEAFGKAIEIDPDIPEAWFNKALALRLINLDRQAWRTWEEFRKLDPSSPWADEAARRIGDLEEHRRKTRPADELFQDFMAAYHAHDDDNAYRILTNYRELSSGRFVAPRIARLALTAPDAADKADYLGALEYIGRLENERSGDPFFAEMAKFYSALPQAKQIALGSAYETFFNGSNLLNKDVVKALEEFRSAQSVFEKNGDKWNAGLATFWIGYALNRNKDIAQSNTVLLSAAETYKEYKWLCSLYFGWLFHNMTATRKFSKALEYNGKALALSREIGDLVLTERGYTQRAEAYHYVGQYDRSLENVEKAGQIRGSFDSSVTQKWRDIDAAVMLFFAMKFYRTAAAYEEEALVIATDELGGDKTFEHQSVTRLGQIHGALGEYKDSLKFFNQGIEIAESFTTETTRALGIAFAKLGRGRTYRESGDCSSALKDFDDSLVFFEEGQFRIFQYEAHKGRLLCYLQNKDNAAFQAELPIILGLFGEYRSDIVEEQSRNSFFENEQDIYDIAVDYEFRGGNYETAFDYAEESRARSLLDMQTAPVEVDEDSDHPDVTFSPSVTEPMKLAEMLPQIPANVQIVQYSVLEDKTLIWLITREGFSVVSAPIRARDLREKVLNHTGMIWKHNISDADKIAESAKELHRLLLGPVYRKLDPAKEICIIADKILFRLSFSTLISPDTGKYFPVEYVSISSPSLNSFLNSTRKAEEYKEVSAENLLSIGNPSFNEKTFEGLKPLESAETEAEKVAELYDPKVLLTGKDAQKARVVAEMPKASVIHFGGHYLVNENFPLLSGFILSEDPVTHSREKSILTNHEILRDKLANARLIVLAACETGVEKYYDGEGMIGASRTFLAAGVPLVVASQWSVDSDATTEIMVRFHKYRKTGGLSTAQALRRAQLDMLEGDNKLYRDPYYWAGFVTFGGYTKF